MSYRISILDKSPLADGETAAQALKRTLSLAQQAESWGYHRFWIAEHHNTDQLASPSPEVAIGWLLGQTRRIRIGSGGVMLQHYSPYKVAENFNLLAALAPGRVDLGVGKAPGGLPLSTRALQQGVAQPERLTFADRLAQLASDNRTRIGSDVDVARLLAGSLGLKLKLVPTAWEDWPLGIAAGRYDAALINIAVTEQRKQKFDFATYRVDSLAFSVKADSPIAAIRGPADLAGKRVIVGAGTNQERILLGWNEINEKAGQKPALPIYVTDDASSSLYIQSGRADVLFGPQSVAAYKAALNGTTKVVGLGPKKAFVAVTTKKGNGLAYAIQAAINGAIARGELATILARWGEAGESVGQSEVNPPGITYP
ncbi:ABC transporter substrate-binding protein [Pluralibacter gergoviae]|nr:ABC transporter substrate-binding protein [Pluralibacter gergoviae]